MGSRRLYDYVDDNPFVEMREVDYVNDIHNIRQNPKMVAINRQSKWMQQVKYVLVPIGTKIYSGVGGQMDFIRGGSLE